MLITSSADEEADLEQKRPRDHEPLELPTAQLVRVLAEHVRRIQPNRGNLGSGRAEGHRVSHGMPVRLSRS
jgi:hypothetical protein